MTAVKITDAKDQWSRLVARAAAGESFVITRRGQPIAKLVAVGEPTADASRQERQEER